jgi:hypothetical protein
LAGLAPQMELGRFSGGGLRMFAFAAANLPDRTIPFAPCEIDDPPLEAAPRL